MDLKTLLKKSGSEVEDIRFYTIHPLKEIHNQIISNSNQNRFLKLWKEMEDLLIHAQDSSQKGKLYCLSMFFECREA